MRTYKARPMKTDGEYRMQKEKKRLGEEKPMKR